jgi:hypothetical protein
MFFVYFTKQDAMWLNGKTKVRFTTWGIYARGKVTPVSNDSSDITVPMGHENIKRK